MKKEYNEIEAKEIRERLSKMDKDELVSTMTGILLSLKHHDLGLDKLI